MKTFRTQVPTKKSKEEFLMRMAETIALRNELVNFFNKVYRPMLKTYNGKVLTMRLLNSLNKQGEQQPHKVTCRLNDSKTEITFSVMHSGHNYNDVETLYTRVQTDLDGRILFVASMRDQYTLVWLNNFKKTTKECVKCQRNYDKYLKQVAVLHNMIQSYGEIPAHFRYEAIDARGFSTYLLGH